MLDGNELRALIRDVIAGELAAVKRDSAPAAPAPAEHRVQIASDADLAAFAKQVLILANDPASRSASPATTVGKSLVMAMFSDPDVRIIHRTIDQL